MTTNANMQVYRLDGINVNHLFLVETGLALLDAIMSGDQDRAQAILAVAQEAHKTGKIDPPLLKEIFDRIKMTIDHYAEVNGLVDDSPEEG